MDWYKTSASHWAHHKIADLPDREYRIWHHGIAYAAQYETGGVVPAAGLKIIGGTKRNAEKLVAAGLWHPIDGGWLIHDYDDHQEAAINIERKKRADSERKRAARVRGHSSDTNTTTVRGHSADSPRNVSGKSRDVPRNVAVESRVEKRREDLKGIPRDVNVLTRELSVDADAHHPAPTVDMAPPVFSGVME